MSVPVKYREMGDFEKYYRGRATAPFLTLVIGGNHESSGYMTELHYGGWLAENIYYLGAAGVVNFRGLRIAGLSGIYKPEDYILNHHERLPFEHHETKSAYHVRRIDAMKLDLVSPPVDIALSHDWPAGIERFGNLTKLLKVKKHLGPDISRNQLGSPPAMALLKRMQPRYWFAAHLHVRYEARFVHQEPEEITLDGNHSEHATQFLALGKCHPKGGYQELVEIKVRNPDKKENSLMYDAEWLAITKTMDKYYSTKLDQASLPSVDQLDILKDEIKANLKQITQSLDSLTIPLNFVATLPEHSQPTSDQPPSSSNPQTDAFCAMLGIQNTF